MDQKQKVTLESSDACKSQGSKKIIILFAEKMTMSQCHRSKYKNLIHNEVSTKKRFTLLLNSK